MSATSSYSVDPAKTAHTRPHIVILGGGFSGVYVTKKLIPWLRRATKKGGIDITIVSRTNYFLFTPLLHEVATGALTPTCVAEPLREVFFGTDVRIIQGEVDSIDSANKKVIISDVPESYDYLVIATGAETNYYNIPGAEELSYSLKDLSDAARIRSRVIDSFEKAARSSDAAERARLLSFTVVGGGATGVEMAAELAEFVEGITRRYYRSMHWGSDEPKVSLIHTGPELLQMFAPRLRSAAEKRLQKEGVALHLNSSVTSVTKDGVTLSNNTTVPAATVIWSAGVKSIIPKFDGNQPVVVHGRLSVDEHFLVSGFSGVFAMGDVAGYPTPMPMLAQVAEAEAATVARNIVASIAGKPLLGFIYRSKGSMVSVGQWFAIGELFSLKISGRLTWWIWRTVYLFKFASMKKRIRIVFEWSLEVFFPRDITKIVR
jgi:NADH dehydrogenase